MGSSISFNWTDFKAGTDVTTIPCLGEKIVSEKKKTGTTLIIKTISEEWSTRAYNSLKRQLALLVANRGAHRDGYKKDPGFNILIDVMDFEGVITDLREDFINAGWGTVTAHINSKHQGVYELNALGIRKRTLTSDRKFPHLSDVKLKIGIFVQDRNQMRDTSVISKTSLSEILSEWGGVQVKLKNFRVFPYGDDDWLKIDEDRGLRRGMPKEELFAFTQTLRDVDPTRVLLSMLSSRSYVGNVEIGTEATHFEMKSNREGFLDSPAFNELKEFTRFAIDWSTIYRDFYMREQAKKELESARGNLTEIAGRSIEQEKTIDVAVDYLQKEIKNISTLLPSKEKRGFEKSFQTATRAILEQDKSSKKELRHLRLVASTSTLLLVFSHEVKSLLGLLENGLSTMHLIDKKLAGKDRPLVTELREQFSVIKERFNELLGLTSLIGVDSKKEEPKKIVLLERIERAENAFQLIIKRYSITLDYKDVPKDLFVGPILEAELFAILLNTLSNSIKSVVAAGGDKKIKIIAKRADGKTIIEILDTGIGISQTRFEDAFIPFIADVDGKLYGNLEKMLNPEDKYIVGTGSGLGLSIVKDIVLSRNGSISFRVPSPGWKAELEVILP